MTMVRQHPPPPQSQLPPAPGPYNNPPHAPPPPPPSRFRHATTLEGRSLAQHPMPQQYAHPLSRHNSYNSQSPDAGTATKPPEHMLRRKTPKGTLAAAYDGTSVENNGEPHATKHILLPVTAESNMPYGLKQDLALRSPGANGGLVHRKQDGSSDWSPSLYFETGSGRSGQHLPQIDSMLNQVPPMQPLLPYQMWGHPYSGPMGPPFQTPLGPTVSNDQGPFGPYWHDGTYIPYRPAAMRDPRFLHHHDHNWSHAPHSAYLGYQYNNTMPNVLNFQSNPMQMNHGPPAFHDIHRSTINYPAYPQHHSSFALDYQNPSLPAPLTQRPQEFLPSGQTTPVQEHYPATTPLDEYGPDSINGQSREKVFAWAHTVYVDLLRYLQLTRKSHYHNAHGRTPSRPHIYPKPPRQPGASFSSTDRQIPERRVSYPAPNQYTFKLEHDVTPGRPPMYHSRSSSAWSSNGHDGTRHPWQDMPPQPSMLPQAQGPGMEPTRTLRRISGSVASVHGLRQDVPPSMTAASALDAITKHCEESSWNWIDGILLGGCLAYALGDYQKAQEWYKHILTLDRE